MGAAKKYTDKKALQALVPFNALSPAHFEEVARKTHIEIVRAGRYLFREGDRDNKSVYVLDGDVNLLAGKEVVGNVDGGTASARHPIAHRQPRQVSARARTSCTVARVDSAILDVFLTWDQSSGYEVQEIREEQDGDWMTRMLQSEAFLKLPPANIQRLLISAESISAKAGDVIVRQGGEGKYFYIIKSGDCVVTRQASSGGKEIKLAELSSGDVFGEEALVSEEKRNATVTMETEGTLMRISKEDFLELLKEPLIEKVTWEAASRLDPLGTEWIDVRLPGEFEKSALPGSRNIPLSTLRHEVDSLDHNTKYVICCDSGRRSASAAFILSQRGFDVYLLLDGLSQVPASELSGELEVTPDAPAAPATAEIYELGAGRSGDDAGTPEQLPAGAIEPAELKQLRLQFEEAVTRNEMLEQNLEAVQLELRGVNDRHQKEIREMRTTVREQTLEFEQDVQEARAKAREMEELAAELRDRVKHLEELDKGKDDDVRQSQNQVQELEEELARALESAKAGDDDTQQRDALEAAQSELHVVQEQHASLKREHEELVTELKHQIEATEEQLLEASNEAVSLRNELEKQARERAALEEDSERIATERAQNDDSVRELQEAMASLKVQHNEEESALRTQISALQSELDNAARTAETAQASLVAENAELREQLAIRAQSSAGSAEEMQALEAETARLREQLQEAAERQNALDAQVAELTTRAESEGELIHQAGLREAELDTQVAAVRAELERVQAEFSAHGDKAGEEMGALRFELETALRERNALENALQRAEERAQELEVAAKSAQAGDSDPMAHASDLESQISTLKGRITALQEERSTAEETITTLEKDLDVSRAALSREQRRVEGYKTRLEESLDSVGEASAAEIEQLHAALDEAEARADAAERRASQLQETVEDVQSRKTEEHASLTAELTQLRQVTTADIEATHAELQRLRQELEIARQANAREADEGEIERLRFLLEEARDQVARYQAGDDVDSMMASSLPVVADAGGDAERDQEAEVARLEEALAAANKRVAEMTQQHDDARAEADDLRHELEINDTRVKLAEASGTATALRERDLADLDFEPEARRRQAGATRGLIFGLLVGVAGAAAFLWYDLRQDAVIEEAPEVVTSLPVAPVVEETQTSPPVPAQAPPEAQVEAQVEEPVQAEAVATAIPREVPVATETGPATAEEIVPEVRAKAVGELRDHLADYAAGPVMVELSGGDFLMGSGTSSLDSDERPRHPVSVPPFAIGKYEVTFAEYDVFADDTGRARPDDEGWGRGDRPVVNVSWYDAAAYAEWLSEQTGKRYRLPTESEWEFMAGATSRSLYWWGTHIGSGRANCFNCGSEWDSNRTAPVGSFQPNLFSLHDTAGNAQEWVQDCYHDSYEFAREDGSAWIETGCSQRVARGGGFNSAANTLRTTKRTQMAPGSRMSTLGFRLARDL